jgi:hypothetical protein
LSQVTGDVGGQRPADERVRLPLKFRALVVLPAADDLEARPVREALLALDVAHLDDAREAGRVPVDAGGDPHARPARHHALTNFFATARAGDLSLLAARVSQHLRLRLECLSGTRSTVAVIGAGLSIMMATVPIEATTMGGNRSRCPGIEERDEGKEREG